MSMNQFRQVSMKTGELTYASTDSLSSFWSGLQVGFVYPLEITPLMYSAGTGWRCAKCH
jgi:hypothetical protein